MIVLNFYGKIEKTCISNKLKLYISNLPEFEHNEWKSELANQLLINRKIEEIILESRESFQSLKDRDSLKNLYKRVFPNKLFNKIESKEIHELASNMICLYFEYDYNDMPLGGWETNCFDGRLCEEDYAEKIIDFINFLSNPLDSEYAFPTPTPQWIYSSNHDEIDYHRIFWGGNTADQFINSMKRWGELFDDLLISTEDYYLLDYLCNAIHADNHYDSYHFIKLFSLCQMFLEDKRESELDFKLPQFLNVYLSTEIRTIQAKLLRQIRNKIAHGDYKGFSEKIEEYAKKILDGRYSYDYSEYSRQNWVLLNSCCELQDALRRIMFLLFTNREKLIKVKKKKS